jgi:arylsulfatase A-like enzyme
VSLAGRLARWPFSGTVLLHLAFLLLRLQGLLDAELDLSSASSLGLPLGAVDDLAVALVALSLALFAGALHPAAELPVWTVGATIAWTSALADRLYFRFFGGRLEWWVVALDWRQLGEVSDSIVDLAAAWTIGASAVCFVLSVAAPVLRSREPARARNGPGRRTAVAAATLAVAALLYQTPITLGLVDPRRVTFRDHILKVWILNATRQNRLSQDSLLRSSGRSATDAAARVLVRYRDSADAGSLRTPVSASESRWPLHIRFAPSAQATAELRERLGLASSVPINVIVLFLETARAFELLHPEIGPAVFPELRSVLARHGILFRQAYASSLTSVPSVRAHFTTLCSFLDNITGPAAYVVRPGLNVRCLQRLFREHGYATVWATAYHASAFNESVFESLHGTDRFYDLRHFLGRGITERIGKWGIADAPFLAEVVRVLAGTAAEGRPFFASVSTSSSHSPFTVIPEGELPEPLARATRRAPRYQAYLSRLRYLDHSLGAFFARLFSESFSRNTLVVLLGDHGTALAPHVRLTPIQRIELALRVPVAIVTRDMAEPGEIAAPVHQIDVAPTIAEAAGVAGPVTWIGRGLFGARGGSPSVYQNGGAIVYRTADRACYPGARGNRCWGAPADVDPLFAPSLDEVAEDPQETEFFRDVVTASGDLVMANAIGPDR